MRFLTNILTGADNKTHDVGRVLAIVSVLVGLGLQIYTVIWQTQPFSLQQFGVGCAALFAGIGGMLWLKKDTEPNP